MKKITILMILLSIFAFDESYSKSRYKIKTIYKYYKAKKFKKVKSQLELWLTNSPTTFPESGFLLLGNVYDHLKMFPIAIKIYEKGMSRSKNKFPYQLNIAQVYRHQKNHKKSLELLEKLKEKSSVYPEIQLFMGMSHFELRDRINTIRSWENYLVFKSSGKKSDKVRRALAWLKKKDFQWPEDLKKKREQDSKDLKKFFEDLKKSISNEKIKSLKDKPNVKEGKLEIKDKGKAEGEKFDEIER